MVANVDDCLKSIIPPITIICKEKKLMYIACNIVQINNHQNSYKID